MTRLECEKKLLELAEQMRAVYEEYNPAGDHLSAIMGADGYICVDDGFFTAEREIILDVNDQIFQTVNVSKYSDGHIRYGCTVKEGAA